MDFDFAMWSVSICLGCAAQGRFLLQGADVDWKNARITSLFLQAFFTSFECMLHFEILAARQVAAQSSIECLASSRSEVQK